MSRRAIAIVMWVAGTVAAAPPVSETQQRTDAQALHQAAQTSDAVADYEHAAEAYRAYLVAYPNAPAAIELRFLRGQILILKLHRWAAGGDEMMVVARSEPPGKFHEEALLEAIDAFAAVPDDAKLDAAADRFVALFGASSPQIVGVMFKVARRRFLRGDYADAAKRFAMIAQRYPLDVNTGAAADMWIESLIHLAAYAEVEAAARSLVSAPAFASGNQQAHLATVIVASILARAEALAGKHDARGAAVLYQRIADEYPRDRGANDALYNAGVLFEVANDVPRALAALHRVTGTYAPKALARAADIETMFAPSRAPETYLQIVELCATCAEAPDALYNAGVLFTAVGDTTKARAAFERYIRQFPNRIDADAVGLSLGMLAERAGDDAGAMAAYDTYAKLRTHRRIPEAMVHLVEAALRLGRRDRARTTLDALHALATHDAQLQAEIQLADADLAASTAMAAAPRDRTHLIELAHDRYLVLIDHGEPTWQVAALDEYAHLIADPAELYERASTIALANNILSSYALDARARLATLQPKAHPVEHEARGELRAEPAYVPAPILVLAPRP